MITGAGTRLGKAMAIRLSQLGMRVAVHYHHSEAGALETLGELAKQENSHGLFQADLTTLDGIGKLVEAVQQTMGPIAVLVNNAADFFPTPLAEVNEQDWDHLFSLNLKAPFFLCQQVSQTMLAQGQGKILNIVDVAAYKPWPRFLPYCATKAGLVNLTIGLAKALAPSVQVNAIAPGTVMEPHPGTEIDLNISIRQSLLKRIGSPRDIADAAEYLLKSGFLTGVVLPVDGGRMAV